MTDVPLNVTNGTVPDPARFPQYQVTAEPVRIQAELNETSIPAPKGEMASGPRTIGFSIDPVMAAGIILVIAVIAIGIIYLIKRDQNTNEEE